MPFVYFVTHPDVIIDPDVPAPRWPLSERGKARMRALTAQPWLATVGSIYCSTEQKAIDGAAILAEHLALPYTPIDELGEIDRSATGYLPYDEYMVIYEQHFLQPEERIAGWEPAAAAQARIVAAVIALLDHDQSQGGVVIVSHGTVGAFLLSHLNRTPISLSALPGDPNGGYYFCFEAASGAVKHEWRRLVYRDVNK